MNVFDKNAKLMHRAHAAKVMEVKDRSVFSPK